MLTPDDVETLNTWKLIGDRWRATAERIYETVEWCISHRSMEGINKMDFAFDPTGITPGFSGGGSQLPVGKHPVTITKSEGKPTKDNTGGFLELTVTAFDGPAKGLSMPLRLNVHNTNETAVRIAKEQLAAICLVAGVGPFQKTEELHNKPFVVEVTPQKNDAKYTEITGVFDMSGNAPGEGGGAQQGQGQQQQGGGFQQQGGGVQGGGTLPQQGQGGGFGQQQGGQQQQQGGGGGFAQQNTGQQQQGGTTGFGQGQGQQQQQGGGNGWQQQGGGGAATGGGSPGWGQR